MFVYVTGVIRIFKHCKKKHRKHITYKHLHTKDLQHQKFNCEKKLLQEMFTSLY